MKKTIAVLLALICTPVAAQNYLRDDGIFHSVVEGTTSGQVLVNSGGALAGTSVFNGGITPDGLGSPACARGGVVDCTSGVVAAAAAALVAGVPLRLLAGGGYCIRPIQFGGSSPPSGMTLAALPYGISTESSNAAFVSCSIAPTGLAMVRIVNYSAGTTIHQNFTMGPLLIDAAANNSYALELYGSIFSNITATLRGSSVAAFYANADANHVVIDNSWNISFDTQTPAISALMQTTDGAANGIALAANRCVISNPFGTVAGDVIKTDYMNGGCSVDAESSGTGYGVNLGHTTNGVWNVYTEGNSLGGINGTANSKGVEVRGSSQDGVATLLQSCITCVIDVWNLTSTTQVRNLGDAVSQSLYVKGLPATTTPSSGQGWLGANATGGARVGGNGSANDFEVLNSTAATGCNLPHNSAIWNCSGYQINGAAASNHIMLGDGTAYRDSATLPVSVLASSSTTVNGQVCALGSSCTVTATASGVTVGTTTIGSGTTGRVLYDNAGVLGEYTTAQLTAQINVATTALSGALPAWPNNTTTFFRGDGTYTAVGTTALTGTLQAAQEPAHTGDVTNSAGSLALTIAANAVTNAKLATMATNTVKVNATSGTAVPTDQSMPTCATSASALQWNINSGFQCNLAINAATLGSTTFTSPGPIGTGTPGLAIFTTLGAGATTITSASASALTVGLTGATNPAFTIDASTASQVAGLKITGAATGGTVAIAATDSGLNTNVTINAKGSGTIGIGSVSTGAVTVTPALTLSNALTYGGVTLSNAVTGTGNMMLSASPTSTGTFTAATVAATTINAFTQGGNISGGGFQHNNIIIGASTPLAITGTTITATTSFTVPNSISNGIFFNASGGSADAQMYEGAGGALGIKLGTTNTLNMTKADNSSIIDYGVSTASALSLTPALLYWVGSTSDAGAADASVCRRTSNGQLLTGTGTLGICLGTSSARFKHDIAPMGAGLNELVQLAPKNFFYNKDAGDGGKRKQYGFLAEDVAKVLPGVTAPDEKGAPQSVDMLAMVPILVKAVQELNATVKKLEAKIGEKK